MDPRTYFKPLKFHSRLLKYVVSAYYVDFLDKHGNIRDILITARDAHSLRTIDELVSEKILMGSEELGGQEKLSRIKEEISKKNKKSVDDFFMILMNQSFVMMCTVFDTFLVDCVNVISFSRPDILKLVCRKDDINVNEVIDARNYETLLERISKIFIRRFDRTGIVDKFEYLKKLGLNKNDLFKLSSSEYQARFPNPESIIEKIYKKRHDIVHRDEMKIKSYTELSEASDLMGHLIMKWGYFDFVKHFNIPYDFSLLSQENGVRYLF